jgi:glycosyltransferase involved in cell wall biosynthesis
MNILHVNSYYADGRFYKNLYEEQKKQGIDISVYVPAGKEIENDFDYGCYTKIIKNHNALDRYFFHLKHNKISKDIQQQYAMKSFDLIHAHSLFSNGYIAWKMKEKYNIPYIAAIRNTDANIFFKKMIHLRKLGIRILENAERIIFLSPAYCKYVINEYMPPNIREKLFSKSTIVPNGIDPFWLKNIANDNMKKINGNDIKLVYAGAVNKNKNLKATLEASELLIDQGLKITLNVAGEIKDKPLFKDLISHEFVHYHGVQKKEGLIGIFKENDIFVMPSKTETFGLVYAEAMSQGLPVIYTRGQGFDGQFQDGEIGYAVNAEDPKEIAETVKLIIQNYNEISVRCVNNTRKFDWNLIAQKYKEIYETSL